MFNRIIYTLGIATLLNGCDSGSGPSTPEDIHTGVFIDSAVKGLSYKTATQSGLTDENGHFHYLEGESIEFSIGGIRLGSAEAISVISPFSLAGSMPIISEPRIISTLKSDDISSFDRAINIATLLQALDVDGNPENGIDLGDANSRLSEVTLDLFVKANEFELQQDFKDVLETLEIDVHRSFWNSAQHLYDSLEIDVESNLVGTMTSVSNNSKISTISYTYNDNQLLISKTTDSDSNGTPEQIITYDYDELDRLISTSDSASNKIENITYDSDSNIIEKAFDYPDDSQDLLQTFTYQQSLLTQLETDYQNDGIIDSTASYQYDSEGNMVQHSIANYSDTVHRSVTSYSYLGKKIKSISEDSDADGNPNSIINYNYDEKGNVVSNSSSRYHNDNIDIAINRFSYDSHNHPIRYERDSNQDGEPEYVEEYTYNEQGKRREYKKDLDGDGNWESITQYQYDHQGNRTLMIEDTDGNGVADKIWKAEYQAAILVNPWEEIRKQL